MQHKEEFAELPKDTTIISLILDKQLKNGMHAEVFLIKRPRQYEAALFVGGHFKPGPPVPRPLDNPTDAAAYWMGVRPSIGLSQYEGDTILEEVEIQNKLHHCYFMDRWGHEDDY